MDVLATRVRVTGAPPRYQYRLYAPFDALSPERQSLIHYHSDFGHGLGLLARMSEAIAPMTWLEMSPGHEKLTQGRAIHDLAQQIEARVLSILFTEMTATRVPPLTEGQSDLPDERVRARVAQLVSHVHRPALETSAIHLLDPRRL